MPFQKAVEPTAVIEPGVLQASVEQKLADSRARLDESARALGAAMIRIERGIAGAEAARDAAQASVAAERENLGNLEAAQQAIKDLAESLAASARREVAKERKAALRIEIERLHRAAAAVDLVLPQLAEPIAELRAAEASALELAGGEHTIVGTQIKAAGRALLPAISWGIKFPIGNVFLIQDEHSPSGWMLKLPGGTIITTDAEASLAGHYAGVSVEK